MDKQDVAAWLQALTDKQFSEFFYEHLTSRRIGRDGFTNLHTHLVLGEVRQRVDDVTGSLKPWTIKLLCTSSLESRDDAPIAWRGTCCGFQTGSWRRDATCPVCGSEVRDA